MRSINKIIKMIFICLMLLLISGCTAQPISSSASSSLESDEPDTTSAAIYDPEPKKVIFPKMPTFQLVEIVDMKGSDILALLEQNGFTFIGDSRWYNESTGIVFILWFGEEYYINDSQKSLQAGSPFSDALILWDFPDTGGGDMRRWRDMWPSIVDYLLQGCGFTNELGRGYLNRNSYGIYGISDFREEDGYWSIGIKSDGIKAHISQYYTDADWGFTDEESLLQRVQALYSTVSDTIIAELPYEEGRFSITDGGKVAGKQVLEIKVLDESLSSDEAVKKLVDAWINELSLNPEDYTYVYERE